MQFKIKEILEKLVLSLTQLKNGESGKIVCINSSEDKNLYKRLPINIALGKVTIIRASASPLFPDRYKQNYPKQKK